MSARTAAFLTAFLIFLFTPGITAAVQDDYNTKVLEKGEVVRGDYFAAGESVTISGTVEGDAYVTAGSIVIEGTVGGDVIAAGGTVDILGSVGDDVRVAGGQVVVSGSVGGSVTTMGGSLTLTDSASVGGSVVAGAGSVSVFAPVSGDVTVCSGKVIIGSKVGGGVRAGAGMLTLTSNADIAGGLTYWSGKEANIQPGAVVGGEVMREAVPEGRGAALIGAAVLGSMLFFFLLANFVSSLIVGLLYVRFYPVYMRESISLINERPLAVLGVGFLMLCVMPAVAWLLMFTVLAVPLAIFLVLYLLLILFFANIFGSFYIGSMVFKLLGREVADRWALVVGMVIYTILLLIPVFGWMVAVLVLYFGAGCLIMQKFALTAKMREQGML